ncbi:MAG TPA: iron-sulfur cluster assembly accessory protein [Verrucomicrobiales bacterium]|nr:iron-sulfur cluster assembly accessory protein [Verrucomicrobiales bacterium]
MIQLTDSALQHLRHLLDEKGAPVGSGLRIAVERGGCAGLQYTMRISQPQDGDEVDSKQGVPLIVDRESLAYLEGCQIDYLEALHDSGFKIENPNAARSCGCGTSFEPLKGS